MISKFSVRKPFTVVVAVILVIILGVVSFTRMQTDLLPNMNLPYVLIMTTYGGAAPEEVESSVTKPIEQAVATVGGLKEMTSTSSENVSLVMMEFDSDVSLDSVTFDIRENLDLIESTLPDEVGTPTLMKVSMDMMPVVVTAIDSDKMDAGELSEYVEDTLEPQLESVDGVASVSTTGLVEENVNVIISDKKIAKLNKKIKNALNGKFDDAEDKLDAAQEKINKAQTQLDSQKTAANTQISKAKKALNDAQLSVTEKEIQVTSAKVTLQSNISQAEAAQKQLESAVKTLKKQLSTAQESLKKLQAAGQGDSEDAQTLEATISTLQTQIASYNTQIKTYKSTISSLNKQVKKMDTALKAIKKGQSTISTQLETVDEKSASASDAMTNAQITLTTNSDKISTSKKELETQKEAAIKAADVSKTITSDTVKALLQAQNFEMPAGYITEDNVDYLVRVGDKVTSQEDLENLVLMDIGVDGINPITLKDVADVAVASTEGDTYCKVNGNDGILLSIQKQSTYSTAVVSDNIAEKLDKITKSKSDLHYTNLMDQGVYIDEIVNSVLQNLVLGAIFAVIVLLLFLKDLRPTLVVAFSIPISVVFALVLMYFTGITLNIISLSGLALGVGMLVDNSIVVIENIYRLRNEGHSAEEAAIEGARGVAGAITASTLTTISVFVPIIFTSGLTKQIFADMALTIGYSLVASLIVALTLVPMMGSGLLQNVQQKPNRLINGVKGIYTKLMGGVLKLRIVVVILAIVLFVASVGIMATQGVSFFPTMESPQMTMTLTMPDGSSQEELEDMANTVVSKTLEIKDVKKVGSMQGGASIMSSMTGGSSNTVSMYILLKDKRTMTNTQIQKSIEKKTKNFDCELEVSASTMDMSSLTGSGVSFTIKGNDLDQLRSLADDVADIVENTKGTENVSDGQEETTTGVHVIVDKKKAIEYGLTTAQVYQAVAAELSDGTTATSVEQDEDTFDVVVNKSSDIKSRDDLKNLELTGTVGSEEKTVKLGNICTIEDDNSLSSIGRQNQARYISVTADVKDGYSGSKLTSKIEKKVKKLDTPKGYTIESSGETETIYEMMKQIALMLVLAIVFMYLIMVAQFQSLISPFIILFTIPLAFTGGIIGLLVCRMDLSIIAMIGFVMLSGIIVNNGIVLVDTINQLREQGMEKNEAIITAGGMRLRPIFMTALTTIMGLSLMAVGFGQGSEMSQPMAVVTIGGLLYGTILTLVVVPSIYSLIMRDGTRRFHLPGYEKRAAKKAAKQAKKAEKEAAREAKRAEKAAKKAAKKSSENE